MKRGCKEEGKREWGERKGRKREPSSGLQAKRIRYT